MAARASAACESTMAICVSVSGGSRITRFLPVTIDQPEGTMNVAPPGVTRGVSAATRSGADLVSDACPGVGGFAAKSGAGAAVNARKAKRIVRDRSMYFYLPQNWPQEYRNSAGEGNRGELPLQRFRERCLWRARVARQRDWLPGADDFDRGAQCEELFQALGIFVVQRVVDVLFEVSAKVLFR